MKARLNIVSGDARPESLDLEPSQAASLGRSRDNTVVLRSEHSSRLHAKILFDDGRWQIQDFSMNGTFVNGERIQQRADLTGGQEIRIGDIRLRFSLDDLPSTANIRPANTERRDKPTLSGSVTTSRLHAADMGVLASFMAAHAGDDDASRLLGEALSLFLAQSGATATGYLSPDPADPLPKIVKPDSASFDNAVSRYLTRRAQRDGKTIWLATDVADSRPMDTMREVTDAICVPVRSAGLAQGMLHAYRKIGYFTDRDVRFAEAMADFLAGCVRGLRHRQNLEVELARLRAHPPIVEDLIGDSSAMVQLRQEIAQIGPQPVAVLVHGEPGVGVELVALALHRRSPRINGPFVAAACSAIAPALLELELFGPRPSGSAPGLCAQADEGTLFLDEVADLSSDTQAKLIRLMDEKVFRTGGSTPEIRLDVRADVRLIAGTQADLEEAVGRNQFRKPLWDRLSQAVIEVPPLRAHLDDIPYLVQYFLDKLATECRRQVTLTDAAMQKLKAYVWPGNHRQLRAELEAAVLRVGRDVIDEGDVLVGCERHLLAKH
jgi:Nif-specific regulatory protein